MKGATRDSAGGSYVVSGFNPRAREGRDPNPTLKELKELFVSIHAPVKGATPETTDFRAVFHVSIHAPVKGATFARGTRFNRRRRFNPRAREGRDRWRNTTAIRRAVSIHAPVKGATFSSAAPFTISKAFQSTRP